MKQKLPRFVWISGLLLLLASFVYVGVSGAGIPDQNPTPEMLARGIS